MRLNSDLPAVGLITSCGPAHFHLLAPFVEHYQRSGVARFFINIHFDTTFPQSTHQAYYAEAEALLAPLGKKPHSVYACPFDAMSVRQHHESIQAQVAEEIPWIVWADIDEFHEFGLPLPDLVSALELHGFDYVRGRFVDRMARMGFPPIQTTQSIWQQFPLGTDMTRSVLRGLIDKIALSRSRIQVIPGHHAIREGQSAVGMPGTIAVHHFKWDAGVVDRLQRRLQKDWKERCSWWTQSERALDWMGLAPPESFPGLKVFDFEDDRRADGGGPFSGNPRYMHNGGTAFASVDAEARLRSIKSFAGDRA
ncbi:MAG: hypothetical protein QM776_13555 [Rhodocyclaceae bacterium]